MTVFYFLGIEVWIPGKALNAHHKILIRSLIRQSHNQTEQKTRFLSLNILRFSFLVEIFNLLNVDHFIDVSFLRSPTKIFFSSHPSFSTFCRDFSATYQNLKLYFRGLITKLDRFVTMILLRFISKTHCFKLVLQKESKTLTCFGESLGILYLCVTVRRVLN